MTDAERKEEEGEGEFKMADFMLENPFTKRLGEIAEAFRRAGNFDGMLLQYGDFRSEILRLRVAPFNSLGQEPTAVSPYVLGINHNTTGFYVKGLEVSSAKRPAADTTPSKIEIGGEIVTREMVERVQDKLGIKIVGGKDGNQSFGLR